MLSRILQKYVYTQVCPSHMARYQTPPRHRLSTSVYRDLTLVYLPIVRTRLSCAHPFLQPMQAGQPYRGRGGDKPRGGKRDVPDTARTTAGPRTRGETRLPQARADNEATVFHRYVVLLGTVFFMGWVDRRVEECPPLNQKRCSCEKCLVLQRY